jgi:hypothetical protein
LRRKDKAFSYENGWRENECCWLGSSLGGVMRMGLKHAGWTGGIQINGFGTLIGLDGRVNGPCRRFAEVGIPRVRALN